jgi:hypothetical protein
MADPYDDPSANLWSTYLSKSDKYDKTMAQNWKSDMDAILIFVSNTVLALECPF